MSIFIYRVPGPVPTRVREMLDHRYGAGNWRAQWEDDYREYTRRLACGMGFYERAPLYAYAYRWKRP